jgi:hypothetical protein
MTLARQGHAATLLPNGKVLITGGFNSASAELYDPAAGTFAATGNMAKPRVLHTSTLLPNGKVLIIAGGPDACAGLACDPSRESGDRSAELYDPAAGTFTATGSMTVSRLGGYTSTLLPNSNVLVVGGDDFGILASAELYDPAAGTFRATGSMTVARELHAATLLPSGKVLVAGGHDGTRTLASAELYE